jgi:hypothetical protein
LVDERQIAAWGSMKSSVDKVGSRRATFCRWRRRRFPRASACRRARQASSSPHTPSSNEATCPLLSAARARAPCPAWLHSPTVTNWLADRNALARCTAAKTVPANRRSRLMQPPRQAKEFVAQRTQYWGKENESQDDNRDLCAGRDAWDSRRRLSRGVQRPAHHKSWALREASQRAL